MGEDRRRRSDAELRQHDEDPDAHGPFRRIHDADERAHSAARHAQTNEWIARFQVPMERRQMAHEADMKAMWMAIGDLKVFKGQVVLVGSVALVTLGAAIGALFVKVFA